MILLPDTASWDDLIECFHVMFKAVEGKMYRPYVSMNTIIYTKISGIIKQEELFETLYVN